MGGQKPFYLYFCGAEGKVGWISSLGGKKTKVGYSNRGKGTPAQDEGKKSTPPPKGGVPYVDDPEKEAKRLKNRARKQKASQRKAEMRGALEEASAGAQDGFGGSFQDWTTSRPGKGGGGGKGKGKRGGKRW